jgi:hypothetical protein
VGSQRGEEAEWTVERILFDVGVVIIYSIRAAAGKEAVGIRAMDDRYVVTASGQFIGKPPDEDAIATKIVGWIERRNHAEAERRGGHPKASR